MDTQQTPDSTGWLSGGGGGGWKVLSAHPPTSGHYYLPPTLRKSAAAAARPGGHIQPLRHQLAGGEGGEEGGEESHLKVADLQQSAGLTVVIFNTETESNHSIDCSFPPL